LTPGDRAGIASVDVGWPIDVVCKTCRGCCRMSLCPQAGGNDQGIDSLFLPPDAFVAAPMELPVVEPADGDGEAIANFAPYRPLLRKLDVVGIRRGATANKARLSGHEPQMVAIALADGFAYYGDFIGTRLALPRPAAIPVCLPLFRLRRRRWAAELREP
jgi:hypothetical protein